MSTVPPPPRPPAELLPRPAPPATALERFRRIADALGLPVAKLAAGVVAVLAAVVVAVVVVARGLAPGPPPELQMPRAGGEGDPALTTTTVEAIRLVHVAGAVVSPGVYEVGDGARVKDVLDAAGGPTAEADLDRMNLAAEVSDGQHVYVVRRGEAPPAAAGSGAAAPGGAAPAVLDLNTATAEQLDELPGIGPSTAEAIVAYRSEHGRFRSVEQLLEVRGIGEAKLEAIRKRVRV